MDVLMSTPVSESPPLTTGRSRVRALRRARRYLAQSERPLARILRAYPRMVARDPRKAFLPER
jgi:hypothetical protein